MQTPVLACQTLAFKTLCVLWLVAVSTCAFAQNTPPLELRKSYDINPNAARVTAVSLPNAQVMRRADPDPPVDLAAAAAAAERQAVLRATITPTEPRRATKDGLGDSFANRVLRVQYKRPPILQIALPD